MNLTSIFKQTVAYQPTPLYNVAHSDLIKDFKKSSLTGCASDKHRFHSNKILLALSDYVLKLKRFTLYIFEGYSLFKKF